MANDVEVGPRIHASCGTAAAMLCCIESCRFSPLFARLKINLDCVAVDIWHIKTNEPPPYEESSGLISGQGISSQHISANPWCTVRPPVYDLGVLPTCHLATSSSCLAESSD